ncbi:amino acid ABC transporter permease [Lysinimonas soli]|uniref:Amino acid ABC transporter permease n=1 Tax=Lysinimonas soli TaxID=1074233 RepID=A0ABW0NRN4_9MICO
MNDIVTTFSNLLPGFWLTLRMAAASAGVGIPLGFLAGLLLTSHRRALRYPVIVLVEIFRGFPALLTLYLLYFGLERIVLIDMFTAVVIAFGVTAGAYSAEIFRAAITSVPRGQLEAAAALALPRARTVWSIVVPHVLRVAVPPIIGIVILVFQGTALAYAIGAKELLGSAFSTGIMTGSLFPQLIAASILYLLVTVALTGLERLAARRAARIAGTSTPMTRRALVIAET